MRSRAGDCLPHRAAGVVAELFVDASAWYPLARPDLPDHERLAQALDQAVRRGIRVVTTNLIVAEAHALLLRRPSREVALGFLQAVREPPNVVVTSTPALEAAAIAQWLERYEDQDFSFADAVSFAVMAERGIQEALTLDRHFGAAGFRMVPG
jgi:predicted nucleic acid-binding protein